MKSLAGEGGINSNNTTITAIRKATDAQYEAVKSSLTANNEVQESGEKTYMWFENGIIFYYSLADNVYLNPISGGTFRKMLNLVDASGLAYLNTTYVTDMNRMFQDTSMISDTSVFANWDTGNVTSMYFMFGSNWSSGVGCSPRMNFSNLTPFANWNVSNVTTMNQMFKCNADLSNLTPIANWDVRNVTDMTQMFNRTAVTDVSPVINWQVTNVASGKFSQMFANTPNLSSYASWPKFTHRSGSWANNGSYNINASSPATGPVAVPTKTPSADQQVCSGSAWNKSQEANGIWTCTLTVSNDDSIYKVWEDTTGLDDYDVSNPESDKITIENNAANLVNIRMSAGNRAINLRKIVTGDAADTSRYFNFQVNAYDENGVLVPNYSRTIKLKHNETMTVLVFTIPQEYSYEIIEEGTEYTSYNSIVDTNNSAVIKAQAPGTTTGRITPTENQTVTFTNTKTNSPTKTITIFKKWKGDISADRPNITAYLNKTSANFITGAELNARMKQLAGTTASVDAMDNNIIAINMATKAQYEAVAGSLGTNNQVQTTTSPNPIYMWFDRGTIYIYTPADNIYMNPDSSSAFAKLMNVTDTTALRYFNTAYVTNMRRMFMDSTKITNLNDLAGWDTGNVTDMSYMFSATWDSSGYTPMNISDLSPISGWNTQKVTTMDSMFKCAGSVYNVDALARWNVSNLTNMEQMFNRAGLTNMEGIVEWDVTRVSNFNNTLNNLPNLTIRPEFTNRTGSWNSNGTYVPDLAAITTPLPTPTKVPSPDQQICSGASWNKTQDASGVWVCELTVSNDDSIYKVWEDAVDGYEESALAANPVAVASNMATITNEREGYTITYKKVVKGNMGDLTQNFSFPIRVYDMNGDEVPGYATTETLKDGRFKSIVIPAGYSYQISEAQTDYTSSYQIIDTDNNTTIAFSTGISTGIIKPTEDQTVVFTNSRGGSPITGVFISQEPFYVVTQLGGGLLMLGFGRIMIIRSWRKERRKKGGKM